MVVVMAALLAALGGAAAHATDDLLTVSVLPVPGAHPLAGRLEGVVRDALPPGFRFVGLEESLRAVHTEQPECRALPRCLDTFKPSDADLLLDVRVTDRAGGTVVWMRVLERDEEVARASWFVTSRALAPLVSDAVRRTLRPRALDIRHYRAAVDGSESSDKALRERFPESPWTRELSAPEPAEGGSP